MGNVNISYPYEDDPEAYLAALAEDVLDLSTSSLLHVWNADTMDHMRLPGRTTIHSFLTRDLRQLFYRWLHITGVNSELPSSSFDGSAMPKIYSGALSFRDYMIYHVLMQEAGSPSFDDIRSELAQVWSTERAGIVSLAYAAENQYDSASYEQRTAWRQQYGTEYETYKLTNGYGAENILYSPAYPDIIFTSVQGGTSSQDSPHIKIPPIVTYRIRKSAPASRNKKVPFGPDKDWGWNPAGPFADSSDAANVYNLRFRWWETLVEFASFGRSGAEAEALCLLFDQFMELNERYMLMTGVNRILPWGWSGEPDLKLDSAGLHYRKSLWYFRTQHSQLHGPATVVTSVDLDVSQQ